MRHDEVPLELRQEFAAARAELELVEARAALRRLIEVHGRAYGLQDWAIGHPQQAEVLEAALRRTREEIDQFLAKFHEPRPAAAPAARQQP